MALKLSPNAANTDFDMVSTPFTGDVGDALNKLCEFEIPFEFSNDGAVLNTGEQQTVYEAPCDGAIESVVLFANEVGSIVVDVWKCAYINYPPTDINSITGATPPTITAAIKSEDTVLTGWTKTFTKGDVFKWNIDSVASIKSVKGYLRCRRAT